MSDKMTKIIDQISELSVLELSELVKALEEKFDVKANKVFDIIFLVIQTGGNLLRLKE